MREAGARLMGGDRIGRDVFVRGWPEGLRLVRTTAWQASAFDLYAAYGRVKARTQPAMHVVASRAVMTLEDAIARVAALIGEAIDWTTLEAFLPATIDPAYPPLGAGEFVRRGARACAAGAARAGAGLAVRRSAAEANRMIDEFVRAVEATLFASASPLSPDEIGAYAGEGDVAAALATLAELYAGHGIELVERGGRWHFQTAPDLAHILRRTREEPRRLSRAATETLAIIAYHEPVSRPEIEAIRGVQISEGHARRADGSGLGAHRRAARGAGAAVALRDHGRLPDPLRARARARTCRGSTI